MTASERLRVVYESWRTGDWPDGVNPVQALEALPELIALTEAVEKSSATRLKNQLGQALAALNRKLEGGGTE